MTERPATVVPASAAPRVRASWQRSRTYGVSLDAVEPVFTGAVDTGSLLYECGTQVLAGLQATLGTEPVSLMIADSEGLVLARLCTDRGITRSLDSVHLATGFHFTERNAGTNGLGLALADRAPSLVRAEEHYCTALRGYTCAAAPVLDPVTGDLAGTVNLTTWSSSSSELLLALAQAAAGNTTALMQARAAGRPALPPAPRGTVFHVHVDRLVPGRDDPCRSGGWLRSLDEAGRATLAGAAMLVVGEVGSGRAALAALARRERAPGETILLARPPATEEVASWLELWTPELHHDRTCVVVCDVDALPSWAAVELTRRLVAARRRDGRPQPFVLTAQDYTGIPQPLADVVDTVVEVPALRYRAEDILPLAHRFAADERHRELAFTAQAARALSAYDWPGNVAQLRAVVRAAAARADVIDAQHLPAEVFAGAARPPSRREQLERDEIVRCLTEPGVTVAQAAQRLGMGRATVYRKIAQYGIAVPRGGRRAPAGGR